MIELTIVLLLIESGNTNVLVRAKECLRDILKIIFTREFILNGRFDIVKVISYLEKVICSEGLQELDI